MSKYNFILNKEQNDSYILENVKGIKRQTLNRCQTEIHFYPLKHPSHLMQLTERTLLTHHEELLIALTILISRPRRWSLLHILVFAYHSKPSKYEKHWILYYIQKPMCASVLWGKKDTFFQGLNSIRMFQQWCSCT